VDRGGFIGFKPYMFLSRRADQSQSTVTDMVPEPYWKVAHERGLIILLHIGRHRALADPVNQRAIRRLAERYPRVRLQLAHCARCFTPEIAEAGLPTVADLPNIHVDTSAVTETEVFHILLDVWPRKRIIFGTDNAPAGTARGRVVTFGLGWYHVDEDNCKAFGAPHTPSRPTFLAYENLRAIRYAARRKGWGKAEREDFFLNNACRLLGLP
jgi:glutamate-1-semialdehyde 2,1-aminomutase